MVEPLLQLAWTPSETDAIQGAHAAGQAWAEATLTQPPTLDDTIAELYTALAIETPAATEPIPEVFTVPLAALIALQTHHAANTGPYADLASEEAHAFTVGALEPILDELEDARHEAPEEPVFVDPLGLIILGGSGDNHYEPHDVGPTTWKGAILLVEPAGNDTYDVQVAGPTFIDRSQLPGPGDHVRFQLNNLALELGGNDTYNDRTASADLGGPSTQAILLDRHGNDTYGTTNIARTTAHGSPGFAYLLDEEGNDTYHGDGAYDPHVRQEGSIAYASHGGTAILWDKQGDDIYGAANDAVFTHAVATSRNAKALLWDEEGQDTYRSNLWAFGTSWNDGYARFLEEEGDDAYVVARPNSSFGYHNEELSPFFLNSLLDQGLGEFIDARGQDTYTWKKLGPGKDHVPENDDRFVDTRDDHKHGVFIDCDTPADTDRPCPEDQHQARCTMLGDPRDVRDEVEPVVQMVLSPVEDECRQHGPVP